MFSKGDKIVIRSGPQPEKPDDNTGEIIATFNFGEPPFSWADVPMSDDDYDDDGEPL